MDTVLTFTPGQLLTGILGIFAGFSCIAAAVSWFLKGKTAVQAPERKQDERIADLESRMSKHDDFLAKDKERLDKIEDGNRVTQYAILALLSHGIDGDDIASLKKAKDDLQEYLIRR